jgi:hypothetical protein
MPEQKGPLTQAERENIAGRIIEHAVTRYDDGGWDVIVECHTASSLAGIIWMEPEDDAILTYDEALKSVADGVVAVWADREADAENSAF